MTEFGNLWAKEKGDFWDWMWAQHKDAALTHSLLERAASSASVCEVGCGHGHFLTALLERGWKGRFVGFEFSATGVKQVSNICRIAGIDHHIVEGNFLTQVSPTVPKVDPCDCVVSHGVIQHQAHWLPMTMGMLRLAPVVHLGIGYLNKSQYHQVNCRSKQGYWDVYLSPWLMTEEAEAAGLDVVQQFSFNSTLNRQEMLATVKHHAKVQEA